MADRSNEQLRSFVKEVGWLLLVLNVAVAGYAFLIGTKASGIKFAVILFLWGSALVSSGIVALSFLNIIYVMLSDRRRLKGGKSSKNHQV
jgi:hypothetical protein